MLLITLIIFSSVTFAQDDGDGAFPKGSLAINLGVGLGNIYWGTGYGTNLPVSPTLSVDYALTKRIGIGNIGIGGLVSYSSTKYSSDIGSYSFSGILIGVRGTYHFILRYIITSSHYPNGVITGYGYGPGGKAGAVQPGIFAGAHYFFVPHFGVFAELGYNGFSIFTLGITLKM
jgi:hypothetical protein